MRSYITLRAISTNVQGPLPPLREGEWPDVLQYAVARGLGTVVQAQVPGQLSP